MFLNFSKGIISSGVILSSVVSFASSASAQNRLDMRKDSFDTSSDGFHETKKDEEAAPSFEDIQNANKDEAQLGEDDEQNNEYIDSKDSLNGSSNTKFAKLKKMGKNVVEKIKKLSPTDVALGIVATGSIGSSICLKTKNNNLEKIVQEKDLQISSLNNCKKESESNFANLQEQLSLEKENLGKMEGEKNAAMDRCNKLQEALDNSKWGLGTWALIILGGYLGYVVLAALVGSGLCLYSGDIENILKAGANFAVNAATFGIYRSLYEDDVFPD